MALGLLFYFSYRRRHSVLAKRESEPIVGLSPQDGTGGSANEREIMIGLRGISFPHVSMASPWRFSAR
jgi:hypothetical protein